MRLGADSQPKFTLGFPQQSKFMLNFYFCAAIYHIILLRKLGAREGRMQQPTIYNLVDTVGPCQDFLLFIWAQF